jgi:beta-phosphoglucomutase-like phosphatase (HAD superfamily)
MASTPEKAWRAGRFWWDSAHPGEAGTHSLRAMIFDLDALTDVECDGHRLAFNAAFTAHRLPLQWSAARYRKMLALPDERQRVAAELRARGICTECDVLARVLVEQLCSTKATTLDQRILAADLDPRRGAVELITEGFTAGVAVGVVGDGRRRWVEPLVRQLVGEGLVQTIVTADDVGAPMPTADAYRLALADLGVTAQDVLLFTGSAAGLRNAHAVGLAGVLVDPATAGVRADYDGLRVADCLRLRGRLRAGGNRLVAA